MSRVRAVLALAALLVLAVGIGFAVRGSSNQSAPVVEPLGPQIVAVDEDADDTLLGEGMRGDGATSSSIQDGGRLAMGQEHAFEGVQHVLGIVTNRVDGEPIAEATVQLVAGDFALRIATDAEGKFSQPWSAAGIPSVAVEHDGFAPMRRSDAEFGELIRYEIQPLGRIEGRVTGARLPAGVPHTVGLWSQYELARGNDPLQEIELDDQGKFTFTGMHRGVYGVALLAPYGVVSVVSGINVLPDETSEVELLRSEGTKLVVRIESGRTQQAVPGVLVDWFPIPQGVGRDLAEARGETITVGGDGTFTLDELPPCDVYLRATLPWGGYAARIARLSPPLTQVTWRVDTSVFLNGRVVEHDGSPAAGAFVATAVKQHYKDLESISDIASTVPAFVVSKQAGEQGQFQFEQNARTTTMLLAMATDGSLRFGTADAPRGQFTKSEILVNLPKPRTVQGLVVDAAGEPVAGALVTMTLTIRRAEYPASRTPLVTAEDGTWSVVVGEGQLIKGTVSHPELGDKNYMLRPGETRVVRVELDPGLTLRGRIVDTEGFAIAGAELVVLAKPWYRSGDVQTDSFGRFEVEGLSAGKVSLLEFKAVGYLPASRIELSMPEAANEVVTIVLRPTVPKDPATIEGEIVVQGDQRPVPGLRFDRLRGAAVSLDGTRFRITGLRPGRTTLSAKAPGMEVLPLGTLALAPGATHDVGRFELRTVGRLTVRVSSNGKPIQDAKVTVRRLPVDEGGRPWGSKTFESKATKRKGEYRIDALPRYRWKLVVTHPKFRTYSTEFQLSGRNTTLRPKLKPKT